MTGRPADAGPGDRPDLRVRVRVPAKVNLFLAVRGRRADGYHEIVSVMQTVTVHDTVMADLHNAVGAQHPATRKLMQLRFSHDGTDGVPDGEDNLALRAARALAQTFGATERERGRGNGEIPRTVLRLQKEIPVAAGMAGGSADAAAALLACNRLWDCELDRDELRALGGSVGADVPFCVTGGTALATGVGTATAQVLCRGTYHWVVGTQREPLSTAEVYAAWDAQAEPTEVEPDAVLQALRTDDPEVLGAALYNDLQPMAFQLRPELADAHAALLDAGCLGAVVSGSGPTLVGLAESRRQAETISRRVAHHFDRVTVATSPAGGPELLPDER